MGASPTRQPLQPEATGACQSARKLIPCRFTPYGARFTDLRVFSELPSLYPEAEAQAKRRVREPEPISQ